MKKILFAMPFLFLAACAGDKVVDTTVPADEVQGHMSSTAQAPENTATSNMPGAVLDPVCGMGETGEKFTEMSTVAGKDYHFCSPHCKEMFDKTPEKYTAK